MIKDFLIINCTGKKNDSLGLKINNNFFIQKIQSNINNSRDVLVTNIQEFITREKVKIDEKLTIIVNIGPGSFSSIRTSLAVAKGMQIAKGLQLYGYKDFQLAEFNHKNIEILINENLLENKLIKPVYIS